ncbi:porin family protein [Pedobacter arcticus]|uniref:porin family protein n=1 Tax=Pedobacter arcticus TaxID=752140 RepID=UPI000363098E|nr:porin family protein [Pedobacter arcticus]
MKKLVFAAIFTICTTMLFAQDTYKGFKLGITAHPNFGWLKSEIDGVKSDGLRAGFSYGIIGDFYFADNYAFTTGLKLTTINGQTQNEAAPDKGKQEIYKLQYIEIPAKIKLATGDINGLRFYGEFGLGNAFNVGAKQDVKGVSGVANVEDQNIYKGTAFYRASLIIGGGTQFSIGEKTALDVGLSFNNGFTDIKKGNGTIKSSYLGLNLAVYF